MIDENINKALKALKSPRLSLPQSNDKDSNPGSARKFGRESDLVPSDGEFVTRQASNSANYQNLGDYSKEPRLKRWKSSSHSRHSRSISQRRDHEEKKDEEELEEFLAIEQSCQESDPPSSNLLSSHSSPKKKGVFNQNRRISPYDRSQQRMGMKSQIYTDSRNTDNYFQPKRGTCEDLEQSISLLDDDQPTKGSKRSKNFQIFFHSRVTFVTINNHQCSS